jgi:hypothetical protein
MRAGRPRPKVTRNTQAMATAHAPGIVTAQVLGYIVLETKPVGKGKRWADFSISTGNFVKEPDL